MPEHRDVVVVGASAGGVEALRAVVGGLPPDYPGAVLVVLHVPRDAPSALPAILSRPGRCPRPTPPTARPTAGRIYVAPSDRHLLSATANPADPRAGRERPPPGRRPAVPLGGPGLGPGPSAWCCPGPATTARPAWRDRRARRHRGGPGPRGRAVPVDAAGRPGAGEPTMLRPPPSWARCWPNSPRPHAGPGPGRRRPAARCRGGDVEARPVDRRRAAAGPPVTAARPAAAGCSRSPEPLPRYRCRVGHAWSPESLLDEQAIALEGALWVALRALEEKSALSRRMAERQSAPRRRGRFRACRRRRGGRGGHPPADRPARAGHVPPRTGRPGETRRCVATPGTRTPGGADGTRRTRLRGAAAVPEGGPRLRLHRLQAVQPDAPGRPADEQLGVPRFAGLQDYLEVHPEEFTALFNTILINVTGSSGTRRPGTICAREVLRRCIASRPADAPDPGLERRLCLRRGGVHAGDRAGRDARPGGVPRPGEDLRHRRGRGALTRPGRPATPSAGFRRTGRTARRSTSSRPATGSPSARICAARSSSAATTSSRTRRSPGSTCWPAATP